MDIDKVGGELSGLRKLVQDLVAPQLGVIQAMLTAQGEQTNAMEARLREEIKGLREEMKEGFASARSDTERSMQEVKLFIRAENAERHRDLFRKRVEERERQRPA